MKRTDMLEEITKYLREYARGTYSELEMANLILEMQEEKGMLPPSSKFIDPGHFPGDSFDYNLNQWED